MNRECGGGGGGGRQKQTVLDFKGYREIAMAPCV